MPDRVDLAVRMLGTFEVTRGGQAVEGLESGRLQSMLGYLVAHHPAAVRRDEVAFCLWPDSSEPQARTNLRRLLHTLRRAWPESGGIVETGRVLRLTPEAEGVVDVLAFRRAASDALARTSTPDESALETAADLYAGDLLPSSYDDWVLQAREALRLTAVEVLDRLVEHLEASGAGSAARARGEHLLRLDPLREQTYRSLIRSYAASGDRTRALRLYHTCATTLARELGVEPSPETRAVHAAILRDTAAAGTSGTSGPDGAGTGETTRTAAPATPAGREASRPVGTPRDSSPAPATVFVGRHRERGVLEDAFARARDGSASLVLVTGQPGVGKSRLVDEFATGCARSGAAVARTRSYEAEGRLSYGPVVEWLRSSAAARGVSSLEAVWRSELARILPELGETGGPDHGGLDAQDRRQRLLEAAARAIIGAGPILLVADDVHWSDDDSLAFVHFLLRFAPDAPVLVAATARADDLGPAHAVTAMTTSLARADRFEHIELGPLGKDESAALAEALLGRPLGTEAITEFHRETGGNPLFCVEMVRAGFAGSEDRRLPPAVHAVIEERLSKLSGAAADLVEIAAVVGRGFDVDLLAAAAGGTSEDELVGALDELWHRHIVREHGLAEYDFTHDRIREVAYERIGPARRRLLHGRVASALGARFGRGPASAQIAAHYEAAGLRAEAIAHLRDAAAVAVERFAYADAVALLGRAISLVRAADPSVARDEAELDLRLLLGPALVSLSGYAGDDVRSNYDRALELTTATGRPVPAPILRATGLAALSTCDFHRSTAIADELHRLGERTGDRVAIVEGRYLLGVSAYWLGRMGTSRTYLEQAVAAYDPAHARDHIALFAQDPLLVCTVRLGMTMWHLGYADTARRLAEQAVADADQLGHPFTTCYVLGYASWIGIETGADDFFLEHVERLTRLVERRHVTFWRNLTLNALDGWRSVVEGRIDEGIDKLERARSTSDARPEPLHDHYTLKLEATAHLRAGRGREALDRADLMAAVVERFDQRNFEPDAHRLRGLALRMLGAGPPDIEAAFVRAVATAQQHGDRALELRARLACCTWLTETEAPAAKDQVAELRAVYEAFEEGGGTAELLQAAALLDSP